MRKLVILSLLLISSIYFIGVSKADTPQRFSSFDDELEIIQDLETGCKYIILSEVSYLNGVGVGSITPLMLANGTQDCK